MACGGCGKRRQQQIQIRRPGGLPVSPSLRSPKMPVGVDKKLCPICRSVMRSLHKYNKSIKKVIKTWYCTKPSCPNSRG